MRTGKWLAGIVSFSLLAAGTALVAYGLPEEDENTASRACGWVMESGAWRYYDGDGQLLSDEWRTQGGKWFYLDEEGKLAKDQWLENGGELYRLDSSGARIEDQLYRENGESYYFNEWGSCERNLNGKWIDGNRYSFDEGGRMVKSAWVTEDGNRFYCGADGRQCLDDWYQIDGDWYCFGPWGSVITGDGGVLESPWGDFHVDESTGKWLNEEGDPRPSDAKKKTKPSLRIEDPGVLHPGDTKRIRVAASGASDIEIIPIIDEINESGIAAVKYREGYLTIEAQNCGYWDFCVIADSQKLERSAAVVVNVSVEPYLEIKTGEMELMVNRPQVRTVETKPGTGRASASNAVRIEAYATNPEIVNVQYRENTGEIIVTAYETPGDSMVYVEAVDESGEYEVWSRASFLVTVKANPAVERMGRLAEEMHGIEEKLSKEEVTAEEAAKTTVGLLQRAKRNLMNASAYDWQVWDLSGEIAGGAMEILSAAGIEVIIEPVGESDSVSPDQVGTAGVIYNIPTELFMPGNTIRCKLRIFDSEKELSLPSGVEADMDSAVSVDFSLVIETDSEAADETDEAAGAAGGDGKKLRVTSPILISMPSPVSASGPDESSLLVIHYQGRRGKVLPSVTDEDGTVRFAAYEFSTYAFVYGSYQGIPAIPEIREPAVTSPSDDSSDEAESGRWIRDEKGWWYSYANGIWPSNEWRYLYWNGKGNWYHFNQSGYLDTGWFTDSDGQMYYLHPISDGGMGRMYTGWNEIDGKWYYFNDTKEGSVGALYRGRITPDGYRTGEDGAWQ